MYFCFPNLFWTMVLKYWDRILTCTKHYLLHNINVTVAKFYRDSYQKWELPTNWNFYLSSDCFVLFVCVCVFFFFCGMIWIPTNPMSIGTLSSIESFKNSLVTSPLFSLIYPLPLSNSTTNNSYWLLEENYLIEDRNLLTYKVHICIMNTDKTYVHTNALCHFAAWSDKLNVNTHDN